MIALDPQVLLQHYADCYEQASKYAEAAIGPLEKARAEGSADAFKSLFQGLKAALERSGATIERKDPAS